MNGGLYATVHPTEDDIREIAERHGIQSALMFACAERLELRGARDPRAIARMLWPLDELAAGYAPMTRLLIKPSPPAGAELAEVTARLFAVTAALTRAIEFDPLLPPDLLPPRWAGTTARRRLRNWLATALERHPALGDLAITRALT